MLRGRGCPWVKVVKLWIPCCCIASNSLRLVLSPNGLLPNPGGIGEICSEFRMEIKTLRLRPWHIPEAFLSSLSPKFTSHRGLNPYIPYPPYLIPSVNQCENHHFVALKLPFLLVSRWSPYMSFSHNHFLLNGPARP